MRSLFLALCVLGVCSVSSCATAQEARPAAVASNPKAQLAFFEPTKITIYIPIEHPELLTGSLSPAQLMQASPALAAQLEVLRSHAPVGRLGQYDGVFELSIGMEGFTPVGSATPTLGALNSNEVTPSVQLVIYSEPSLSQSDLDAYLLAALARHPWEHPVIEIYQNGRLRLWSPVRR